jgi:hypothetical protein
MHALLFLPFAILCATVLLSCCVSAIAAETAARPAQPAARDATPRPSAQILAFSGRKTPLPSISGTTRAPTPRPALRLVSNGG